MGVLKFPKLGLLQLWKPTTLRVSLKQSCSLHRDLSNGMWHTTCTQRSQGNSRLLMVWSQIDNLIPGLLFAITYVLITQMAHKPISNIYTPRTFQWYKKLFNLMGCVPCNRSLKTREFIMTPTLKVRARSLGSVEVHSFTLSHTPTLSGHEMWLLGFILGLHFYKPFPWSQAQG
jgi:hypothetical protein